MKLFYKLVLLILLLLLFALFLYNKYKVSPYKISIDEAKRLIKNKTVDVILDVRTDLERKTSAFYPDSVNIQSSEFEKRLPKEFPNKNLHILVYCKSGRRARIATEKLHQLGYKNAKYITSVYNSLL